MVRDGPIVRPELNVIGPTTDCAVAVVKSNLLAAKSYAAFTAVLEAATLEEVIVVKSLMHSPLRLGATTGCEKVALPVAPSRVILPAVFSSLRVPDPLVMLNAPDPMLARTMTPLAPVALESEPWPSRRKRANY